MQMEISLKENVTNSKSKKYNIIKKGFEDIIKIMPVSNNTSNYIYNATLCQCLQKFLYGYHDVVSAFSHENKELKGKMDIYEKKLKEKNELISKKDKEISELKKLIEKFYILWRFIYNGRKQKVHNSNQTRQRIKRQISGYL